MNELDEALTEAMNDLEWAAMRLTMAYIDTIMADELDNNIDSYADAVDFIKILSGYEEQRLKRLAVSLHPSLQQPEACEDGDQLATVTPLFPTPQ